MASASHRSLLQCVQEDDDERAEEPTDEDREREKRFQQAEREIMRVLEDSQMDEHVRKRHVMRLFDRFRLEYTHLSVKLRDNLRSQRRVTDKCLQIKNELIMNALKIKTAKQVQDEELKNLTFYREECEHAWKALQISEERERDAMRIIDELKGEVETLQAQVKALTAQSFKSPTAVYFPGSLTLDQQLNGEIAQLPSGYGADSPGATKLKVKKDLAPLSPSKAASPGQGHESDVTFEIPVVPSLDEWKQCTRVWSPHVVSQQRSPTPTRELLTSQESRADAMLRCASVPSLQPSAMQRAITATSPSRRSKPHTSSGDRNNQLPHVQSSAHH
ncbi:TPA: hypothetical protein N0F65_003172 [Lagenidium giganteum]|uniref:Uncharacterized protein n=1 Tax=Lagenidium giganteum TaxID=4803 RepID=A0AAV2ZCA9_9STRA|nr:TPA: hypothetical protein N0F65_003172 [Lagenidium giganteum]